MELLDLAPVVRRPGSAVSMVASGPRPGRRWSITTFSYFRGADKSRLSDPAVPTRKRHLGVTFRVGNE